MRLVAAPDKFRGTASAAQVADAIASAARTAGWRADRCPLADGGEGTLEVLGGPNRTTTVTGPLGDPVDAGWRIADRTATIEMAAASGLMLVGGAAGNDPIAASTYGTGELIAAALEAGARRIILGVGGSATTDGGLGALRALPPPPRFRGVELVIACDVRTRFLDAAEVFAPQKGASPAQVELLRRRLERLAQVYLEDSNVDVTEALGAGAAGGLAGGLMTIGARLVEGFDLVADEVDFADFVEDADLVVTGEGFLDQESFDGKVVGGVVDIALDLDVPVLVIVGEADPSVDVPGTGDDRTTVVSLVKEFGDDRARGDVAGCVSDVIRTRLGPTA